MNPINFKFSLLLLAISVLVPATSGFAAPPAELLKKKQGVTKVAGIIVKYRQTSQHTLRQQAVDSNGQIVQPSDFAARVRQLQQITGVDMQFQHQMGTGAYVFTSAQPISVSQAKAMAKKIQQQDSNVEYAEPDYINRHYFTPSSPLFKQQQWSMQENSEEKPGAINLPSAWDISMGEGVTVAVIDTGILLHKDLKQNILTGYNFITNPTTARLPGKIVADASGQPLLNPNGSTIISARTNDAIDRGDYGCNGSSSSWHGTHVAGTVAAHAGDNGGITGVAPKAKILPVRVLGVCGGNNSDITDAMIWAAGGTVPGTSINETPAKVLSLSLGGAYPCTRTYRETIQAVHTLGAIVVVAAGNDTEDASGFSPASCPGVISVAANDIKSGIASYSNYGAFTTVTAPGGDSGASIYSTANSGRTAATTDSYANYNGTSMATPHVAGTVALMLAVNPKLNFQSVRDILIKTARQPVTDCEGCSAGIIDAAAAVKAAQSL